MSNSLGHFLQVSRLPVEHVGGRVAAAWMVTPAHLCVFIRIFIQLGVVNIPLILAGRCNSILSWHA